MSELRKVEIQLNRHIPQQLTLVAAFPASWTDKEVENKLGEIYDEVELTDERWVSQVGDHKEGTHALVGTPAPDARPWITYPYEEGEDEKEDGDE